MLKRAALIVVGLAVIVAAALFDFHYFASANSLAFVVGVLIVLFVVVFPER